LGLTTILRQAGATVSAVATAVATVVSGRERMPGATLKPGDVAPDFALEGSDGRVYRLADLTGRTVVMAWFPKAFTAG
jgi:peroxiredoxin